MVVPFPQPAAFLLPGCWTPPQDRGRVSKKDLNPDLIVNPPIYLAAPWVTLESNTRGGRLIGVIGSTEYKPVPLDDQSVIRSAR